MPTLGFQRIQIDCCDTAQAASQYALLMGCKPVWQGSYSVLNEFDTVVDSGLSVWFEFENTRVEFLNSNKTVNSSNTEGTDIAQVSRILFAIDDFDRVSKDLNVTLLSCQYKNDSGSFEEKQLEILGGAQTKSKIAVISTANLNSKGLAVSNFSLQELPRVDHVVLYTNDAPACLKLFQADLSMRLALDKSVPEWGGRMLFFRCGKLTLEIISPTKPFNGADYFWGLAYQVVDIDKTHKRLSNQGISVSAVRKGRKQNTRVMTVKSHHLGVPTLLVEPSVANS